MSDISIFSQSSVFTALAVQFQREAVQARGLQQVVDPTEFNGLFGQQVSIIGQSADFAGAIFQPIQLSLGNIVLLAEAAFGIDTGDFFQNRFSRLDPALNDPEPPLQNLVESAFRNAAFPEAVSTIVLVQAQEETPVTGPTLAFSDFTQRPSENRAFGVTFSGVSNDGSLNTQFARRVGIPSNSSVALSDLIQFDATSSATDIAISLTGENGGGPLGEIQDGTGTSIGTSATIDISQLSDLTFVAPTSGIGLDNISFIELSDPGDDGTFDARGDFQTTVVSFAGAARSRQDLGEDVTDFFFGAESGTSQVFLALDFSGVNSNGFTNAFSAIEGGDLRVRIFENRSDGTRNEAVTDLFQSSGDRIIGVFPFSPTRNGVSGSNIQVEVRSLDSTFDISSIDLRAVFA